MTSKISSAPVPPLLTIIIPVFDNTEELDKNILGLLLQTETRWEAIYAFYGSNPALSRTIECASTMNPRYRLIQEDKSRTIGELFNRCLDTAQGDTILILHAEDYLSPDDLARLTSAIAEHPTEEHSFIIRRSNDINPPIFHNQIPHTLPDHEEVNALLSPEETHYYLYKRSTITKHKLRFEPTNSITFHQDFTIAYAQHTKTVWVIPDELSSFFTSFITPEDFTYPSFVD
ncbi:MAG: glycosyltransferase [Rikenellaceae bacterium]